MIPQFAVAIFKDSLHIISHVSSRFFGADLNIINRERLVRGLKARDLAHSSSHIES